MNTNMTMRLWRPGLFFGVLFAVGCSFGHKGYNLTLIIKGDCEVSIGTKVLMKGDEIGRIEEVTALDSNTTSVKVLIDKDVHLPVSSTVKYRKGLIGDDFIEIDNEAKGLDRESRFLKEADTLHGSYVNQSRILDSAEKEKIFEKLKELKSTLDTIMKKRDSNSKKE